MGRIGGELCALRWSAVDVEVEPSLVISHSIVDVGTGRLLRKDTKTHQVRRVALDAATTAVLARQRARQAELAAEAGVGLADDPYVFSQAVDASTPYRPNRLSALFRRLTRRLELTHITLHGLRHFMATQSIAAGVDIRTVAGRLGHGGGGVITMKTYAHFVHAADRRAADHMGQLVGGEPQELDEAG